MKTALTCVLLCLAAVLFGKRQQARIDALETQLTTAIFARAKRHGDREPDANDYRTKYQRCERGMTAADVFEPALSHIEKNHGVSSGPDVVLDNREAFRLMRQLDLAEQKKMIRLLADSKDSRLDGPYKCGIINVCLCAMADHHPEIALGYLRRCDELIGEFYRGWMDPRYMIHYAIRRLCYQDLAAGLDALAEETKTRTLDDINAAEILTMVAQHSPELALESIPRLSEEAREEPLRRLLSQANGEEQCTRCFNILRAGLRDDPTSMATAVQTLLGNISKNHGPWRKTADWVEALNLTNDEKLCVATAVAGIGDGGVDGASEPTKWLVDYLPPSKERNFLLWRNASGGIWMAADPEAAKAFLRENSIDEEEMRRLESEGFLRPH